MWGAFVFVWHMVLTFFSLTNKRRKQKKKHVPFLRGEGDQKKRTRATNLDVVSNIPLLITYKKCPLCDNFPYGVREI